jgi:hypothetical protein
VKAPAQFATGLLIAVPDVIAPDTQVGSLESHFVTRYKSYLLPHRQFGVSRLSGSASNIAVKYHKRLPLHGINYDTTAHGDEASMWMLRLNLDHKIMGNRSDVILWARLEPDIMSFGKPSIRHPDTEMMSNGIHNCKFDWAKIIHASI